MIGGDLPHPEHRAGAGDGRRRAGGRPTCRCPPTTRSAPTLHDINLDRARRRDRRHRRRVRQRAEGAPRRAVRRAHDRRRRRDSRSTAARSARSTRTQRRELGFGFVPEERLGRGAVPEMSLAENALLTAHRQGLARNGFVRFGAARDFAQATIAEYRVKAGGAAGGRAQPVRRQSAEVHRRPRDPAASAGAGRGAADLGRGRRRRGADPPGAARPARRRASRCW